MTFWKDEVGNLLEIEPISYSRLFAVGQPVIMQSRYFKVLSAELDKDGVQVVVVAPA